MNVWRRSRAKRSIRVDQGDEGVEAGRGVTEGGARALDDVLEALVPIFLEEGPALQCRILTRIPIAAK